MTSWDAKHNEVVTLTPCLQCSLWDVAQSLIVSCGIWTVGDPATAGVGIVGQRYIGLEVPRSGNCISSVVVINSEHYNQQKQQECTENDGSAWCLACHAHSVSLRVRGEERDVGVLGCTHSGSTCGGCTVVSE
ncbi:hypothetical protein LSM04_006609 [Trypanosoma melophagium]|uniref:uncharacterized protein n=1 Tax=Trypanosoma melophagium TaxID=715481 RepID=UPI00351A72E6|nr:hypothetical protein LSM04_006609 [Trypanosoma melophagium]